MHRSHIGKPGGNFWHFFQLGIQVMVFSMNSLELRIVAEQDWLHSLL